MIYPLYVCFLQVFLVDPFWRGRLFVARYSFVKILTVDPCPRGQPLFPRVDNCTQCKISLFSKSSRLTLVQGANLYFLELVTRYHFFQNPHGWPLSKGPTFISSNWWLYSMSVLTFKIRLFSLWYGFKHFEESMHLSKSRNFKLLSPQCW